MGEPARRVDDLLEDAPHGGLVELEAVPGGDLDDGRGIRVGELLRNRLIVFGEIEELRHVFPAHIPRPLWVRAKAANIIANPGRQVAVPAPMSKELISLDRYEGKRAVLKRLSEIRPDLVHFQHEYGIYGGKNPPWYFFPNLVTDLAFKIPTVHMVATAHTVLPPGYRLPLMGWDATDGWRHAAKGNARR